LREYTSVSQRWALETHWALETQVTRCVCAVTRADTPLVNVSKGLLGRKIPAVRRWAVTELPR